MTFLVFRRTNCGVDCGAPSVARASPFTPLITGGETRFTCTAHNKGGRVGRKWDILDIRTHGSGKWRSAGEQRAEGASDSTDRRSDIGPVTPDCPPTCCTKKMQPLDHTDWDLLTDRSNHSVANAGSHGLSNASVNVSGQSMPFRGESTMVTAVISLTVFVIGLTGNTLAIYVVLRYAKMKTVTNIYILNLALADELYIIGMPFLTTQNVLSYWPFGSFLCRVVMMADSINQFTSIFCLTAMSIDRYLAVVHPIKSTKWRRPRVAKVINTVVWALSFVVVLPVVIFSDVQDLFNTCNMNWPEPKATWSTAFILYTAILGFFGPLLVICLCYLLIVIKVKSSGARAGFTKRRKSERKVTRMVVIIVVVFMFCWLPFYLINMVNLVVILPENNVTAGIYFFTVILTYVNSCANPLLYGFLSDNFKQSFRKVLCIHKANGVEDGDPSLPRTEKTTVNDSFLSPRNHDFNGHLQSGQGIQLEPCCNSDVDPQTAGPKVIGQSTL